ncbi:MAG: response regulator transcription factor [Chloroflexota bacterium]
MVSQANILVVEDEANIRASVENILIDDGHQVVAVGSGEEALARISTETFDLALLDLKLPGIGGIEVLTSLRQQSPETAVIILTAHASLDTAVEALRLGAIDYLFKPCIPVELGESIRRGLLSRQSQVQRKDLLRQLEHLSNDLDDIRTTITEKPAKSSPVMTGLSEKAGRFLQRQGIIVDFVRYAITVDGYLLDLTPTEFALLTYLIKQAPRVIGPDELVREVQGYDSEQWEAKDIVRSHIYHIRQKIKAATGRADIVQTVRGVGYSIGE